MKIENHLIKIKHFEDTLMKLDYDEDYETMIEDFLLASAHLINAAMHKLDTLKQDKDIKHNRLYGFLLENKSLKEKSEETANLIQQLDQLRPSHVYGKGENGKTAKKAKEIFTKIKDLCEAIINER